MSIRFYSILSTFIIANATTVAIAQSDSFAPYDCRFHLAEVDLPIPPIPQTELDALEIQVEIVEEWNPIPVFDEADAWKRWSIAHNMAFDRDRGNMPMINDLQSLHPFFRDKVIRLIQLCKKKGIELAVVETYRTEAKQNEYKTLGAKYTRSGAGRSKHQYGMAVDVVPIVDSLAQWDDKTLWKKVGIIGEALGLRWGGRWRTLYDPGHFEWTGGLTSVDLGLGKSPVIPNEKTHYPCLDEDLDLLRMFWEEWSTEQSIMARSEGNAE